MKQQITLDRLVRDYGGLFEKYGHSQQYLRDHFIEWSKNRPASVNDYLWYMFNRLITENRSLTLEQMAYKNSTIYLSMAIFVGKYEGDNPNHYKRLHLEQDLLMYLARDSGVESEINVIANGQYTCDHGIALDGKSMSLEDALREQPLASGKCIITQDFRKPIGCQCWYTYTAKRDENGKLIFKE